MLDLDKLSSDATPKGGAFPSPVPYNICIMGRTTLRMAPKKRLTLITDLHLGDGTYTDQFGRKDGELLRLCDRADTTSDAVVVMGDCFDLLQAPSMRHIVRAHYDVIRRFSRFAQERRLVVLRGNHDFMLDTARWLPGVRLVDRVRLGRDIQLEHGDRFDPWSGHESAGPVRAVNYIERLTRSFLRLPLEEHPDWGNCLGHWAGHKVLLSVRVLQRSFTRFGWKRRAVTLRRFLRYISRYVAGDFNSLFLQISRRLPRWKHTRVLLCGHSHLPGDVQLGEKRYINVGSWARQNTQYCEYNGSDFDLREWKTDRPIRDERYRPLLDHRRLPSFEEWFQKFHREMLTFRF